MSNRQILLNQPNFSMFDFGVHAVSVDFELEFDFLTGRNTIGLKLNFSFDPSPTVPKHAAFRLKHLSAE